MHKLLAIGAGCRQLIILTLLTLKCIQFLDSIHGLLLHALQQRNDLDLLVPGKEVHHLTADPGIDLLTIASNFDRLPLVHRVEQVRRQEEGQFAPTDPVHLKDSIEDLLASQAGRQDPIDRRMIGDQVRAQSRETSKSTRFFGGEDKDDVTVLLISFAEFVLILGRSGPHTPVH